MRLSPLGSFGFLNGYWPSVVKLGVGAVLNSIFWGKNIWLRVNGRVEIARLPLLDSSVDSGLSLQTINLSRASIAGSYVGERVPYNSIVKINDQVLAFISEQTAQQVFVDDAALTGVTTSATAGQLKYARQSGGVWAAWEPGFDDVVLPDANVSDIAGTVPMSGKTGIAIAPWRTISGGFGNPSNTVYRDLTSPRKFLVDLTGFTLPTLQDGWYILGTKWGDTAGGELRLVRKVRIHPTGTVRAENGLTAVVGTATRFLRDFRAGDVFRFDAEGADYTVQSVESDLGLTLTGNYAGSTGSGKVVTIYKASAEWRNNTRGRAIDVDNFKPPAGRGVVLFNNSPFIWGVEGGFIYALKQTNREAVGEYPIERPISDEHINVLAGDDALWIMTTNTLQIVTFTQREDVPYIIRIKLYKGFSNMNAGVIYGNRFYGYCDNPVRVRTEGTADVQFGRSIFSITKRWDRRYVTNWADPKNECVLYCHYDVGSNTTEIVPWMEALEPPVNAVTPSQPQWSVPQYITGRITAGTVIDNRLFLKIDDGVDVKTYAWDEGAYRTDGAVCTPFMDYGADGRRQIIKGFSYVGKVSAVRLFQVLTKGQFPDVSDTAAAKVAQATTNAEIVSREYPINLPNSRGTAIRFDLSGEDANVQEINLVGLPNEVRQ